MIPRNSKVGERALDTMAATLKWALGMPDLVFAIAPLCIHFWGRCEIAVPGRTPMGISVDTQQTTVCPEGIGSGIWTYPTSHLRVVAIVSRARSSTLEFLGITRIPGIRRKSKVGERPRLCYGRHP